MGPILPRLVVSGVGVRSPPDVRVSADLGPRPLGIAFRLMAARSMLGSAVLVYTKRPHITGPRSPNQGQPPPAQGAQLREP